MDEFMMLEDFAEDSRMESREGVIDIIRELKIYYALLEKPHIVFVLNQKRTIDGHPRIYFEV